eukprot:Ihof_evm2s904 gene=Ihof_evmTU2s904
MLFLTETAECLGQRIYLWITDNHAPSIVTPSPSSPSPPSISIMFSTFMRPLERLVAQKAAAVLKTVFEGFDEENFCDNISNGQVLLENITLKHEFIASFGLPLTMISGHIKKVGLKIPWNAFRTEAAEVTIDGVMLLLAPLETPQSYTSAPPTRSQLSASFAREYEDLWRKTRQAYGNRHGASHWDILFQMVMERVGVTLLEHAQITVRNVHVRYEDTVSHRERPFACGLTLENLLMSTATADWAPCPMSDTIGAPIINKVIIMDRLAVYWNCGDYYPLVTLPPHQIVKRLAQLMPSCKGTPQEHTFLLAPCFLRGRVSVVKPSHYQPGLNTMGNITPVAQYSINIQMEELSLALNQQQYNDINLLTTCWEYFARRQPYLLTRPNIPVRLSARVWWQHAIECVLTRVQNRKARFSWDCIKQRRDFRREYLQHYKMVVVTRHPCVQVIQWLHELEDNMTSEDIALFRSIGQARFGHLKDTSDAPPVSMYGWISNGATQLLQTAQTATDVWWLDSNVKAFFERLQTDVQDQVLSDMQDHSQ